MVILHRMVEQAVKRKICHHASLEDSTETRFNGKFRCSLDTHKIIIYVNQISHIMYTRPGSRSLRTTNINRDIDNIEISNEITKLK